MSNVVTAYQTLEDRDNIDQIEMEGPFECVRGNAWLGHGYYFWDTNMEWALAWGRNSYNRRGRNFVICACSLNLSSNCFDLFGNVVDQMSFTNIVKSIRESGLLKGTGDLSVPNVIQFMKQNGLFTYNSIRSSDLPKNTLTVPYGSESEHLAVNPRVQICVINLETVLLQPFSAVYPEKYLT